MKINYDKIKSEAGTFEKFPGYLPGIIRMEINEWEYIDHLKKEGLLEDLYEKLNNSRRYSFQEHLDEFRMWVNNNPEYSDLLIED